jgi:two-component system, NarL family, invasion response regulator UvrY
VVDEAGDGVETLRKVAMGSYDLVLLDISMPDFSGLEVLKKLKRSIPDLPVLVLSMFAERQYAVSAFNAGACGYMTKEEAAQKLIGAIRKVAGGGRYVTPALSGIFTDNRPCPSRRIKPHNDLSGRERQVLVAIAAGRRPSQIASELGLSPKTISTYRSRLMKKIGLSNNAELIRYAIKNDLVTL